MTLYPLSDLHLEFADWRPLAEVVAAADVVVLAGDIHEHTHGLRWARERFGDKPIIYVAGNHEYYGGHLRGVAAQLRKVAKQLGIHYLANDEVILGGIRFLGTTLWTDFQLFGADRQTAAMRSAHGYLHDFHCIQTDAGAFRPEQSVALHQASRRWLTAKLNIPFNGPTIVVSHHAPSMLSIAPRWRDNLNSAAFAGALDEWVARADLWIHGHTHTFADYRIGDQAKGRVICNPRGYPEEVDSCVEHRWQPELLVRV